MVERDKVDALVGEISSASGLAISQVATRAKTLFMQTGCNSDELRGKNRSEEHTSELQSLMRISYAVFCLKKKTQYRQQRSTTSQKYGYKTNKSSKQPTH